jgi:hypothetical protein
MDQEYCFGAAKDESRLGYSIKSHNLVTEKPDGRDGTGGDLPQTRVALVIRSLLINQSG